MDYVLHGYPLSDGFRKRLEAALETTPQYLTLAELRSLPLVALLKRLRGLNAQRLTIVCETEHGQAILPALLCISALAKARKLQVMGPSLVPQPVSRIGAFKSVLGMGIATVDGFLQMHHCRRELRRLAQAAPAVHDCQTTSGRVLYLKANLTFGVTAGGSVGHVAGVVKGLIENGYGVDFVAVEPPAAINAPINYHLAPAPSQFGLPYESNLYRYNNSFVRDAHRFAIQRGDYQFIYQRLSIGNYAGVALSRALGIPLVLEYNGSEVWIANNWTIKHRDPALALAAEDVSLKHADVIVTVSGVLEEELVARGVDRKKIVTYPNCIDPKIYDPDRITADQAAAIRVKHGIAADANVLTFVGTFGPWHGAEVLAETIRQMSHTCPDWLRQHKVHFLLVGDGARMPMVRQLLSDPACKGFFTLPGLVPQLEAPAYLATSDVLVSPHVPNVDGTRFFGSPTKLFEYMAMGRAIIASDLEQIGQVLAKSLRAAHLPSASPVAGAGDLSILCEPGNCEQLTAAIRFAVERSDWRQVLAANARREALQKYSWEKHVAAFLSRLTELSASDTSHASFKRAA